MKNRVAVNEGEPSLFSITPSGFFGNSSDMIVELENFMTEEEQDYLLNFAKKNNSWDYTISKKNENGTVTYDADVWTDRVATFHTLVAVDTKIIDIIRGMFGRLKIEVDKFYSIDAQATSPAIVRWRPGDQQDPHADKELHEGPDAGTPNAFPYYDIASIFYLNDNYEGGELYFPLQEIEFKPKARAAYFFPGDKNYIHGVRPILSGTRYTSPFFWTIIKHTGKKQP